MTRWLIGGLMLTTVFFCLPHQVQELIPTVADLSPTLFNQEEYAPLSARAQTDRIPVLMYHDIIRERGPKSVWFDCTVHEFAEQLQWLTKQGAHPISLADLHRRLVRGDAVPPGAVVLTFDDNYQGFYDNAYPLLKRYRYPAAMFVHTNYVGDKTGDHPHMDWSTLQELDRQGLVTIGSHTLSHPDDMTKLSEEDQTRELTESKAILEQHLGHAIPYLAYPNGRGDAKTREIAKNAGYTMAFTIDNGPAEESPDILAIHRYIHTRFKTAWEDCQARRELVPAAVVEQDLAANPVQLEVGEYAGVKLGLVRGGTPTTRHAAVRQSVGEFVQQAGGVAGINGTFFANAALQGTDAALIGPSQTPDTGNFEPDYAPDRLGRLVNRPLVVWGATKIVIVPFQPGIMNDPAALRALAPDFTDVFLGGAWLVHDGQARTSEEMAFCAPADFDDPRRRAFFGFTKAGDIALGATLDVVTTTRMAEAAAAAGVQEAVLLDSGFSTSLVYDNKIIVTGHTAVNVPSRPVPHAIVLLGTPAPVTDPEVVALLQEAAPALAPEGSTLAPDSGDAPHPRLRRRRRRSHGHRSRRSPDSPPPAAT